MKRSILIVISLKALTLLMVATGCDKEKIVESTEYVHETEYIELPPDTVTVTVTHTDTVYSSDSVIVNTTDTVIVYDTIIQVSQDNDTVYVIDTIREYDTVIQYQTVYEYDTVVNLIYEVDTVTINNCGPKASTAFAALQYNTDQLVIALIYENFGYDDGWVFYLSTWQSSVVQSSSNTWDIYGYIDYWTPDWSGYYALEYYYRMTYLGGDPEAPASWQMTEPPAAAPAGQKPGVHVSSKTNEAQHSLQK
jgi:hypothetical protein